MDNARILDRVWTEAELAYFAGVLDGEGCFTLARHGRTFSAGIVMHVGNTDPRLPLWIQERFGGKVAMERRQTVRHKDKWRWSSHVGNIEQIIVAVLPYLVLKRNQAELLLAYRKTLAPPITGHRHRSVDVLSDDVKTERHRIFATLTSLNKRGA